ncbi:MAG: hypothetical protein K2X37_13055 [Chitinophagaceae bacterium]|nr:hypothetical protein [Chitinophagaceae bacterium]
MKEQRIYKKWAIIGALMLSVQLAYATFSFTGIVDDKTRNNKYTLRSLSNFSKKGLSISALKSTLQFKGLQVIPTAPSTSSDVQTIFQYDNGNTTYVYPYRFKVKVPRFKTPQPTNR